jgi:lipid A disaccharide synthetase
MAVEGVVSPFPIDQLAIVGVSAIPARSPLILRRIRETADAIVAARPDVLVIIELSVAQGVRRNCLLEKIEVFIDCLTYF